MQVIRLLIRAEPGLVLILRGFLVCFNSYRSSVSTFSVERLTFCTGFDSGLASFQKFRNWLILNYSF